MKLLTFKITVQAIWGIALAAINGAVFFISYITTQGLGTTVQYTTIAGVQVIVNGIFASIHYVETNPTPTDTPTQMTDLTTGLTSLVTEIKTLVQNVQTAPVLSPSNVTNTTNTPVGTYQGWTVKIVNGFLQTYPPSGSGMVGVGSVIGYNLSTNFMQLAQPVIDAQIAAQRANTASPNPQATGAA